VKAVFDTNVVASGSFWRGTPFKCLSAWAKGGFDLAVSPPLLAEYQETLELLRKEYPGRPFVDWPSALAESAELVFPMERATGATPDSDDEMVLECALAAEADCIVSGDKRHLLSLGDFRDIHIISPADFLVLINAT
jgi:putative PIN family toxin of toxin-antitoxin system